MIFTIILLLLQAPLRDFDSERNLENMVDLMLTILKVASPLVVLSFAAFIFISYMRNDGGESGQFTRSAKPAPTQKAENSKISICPYCGNRYREEKLQCPTCGGKMG